MLRLKVDPYARSVLDLIEEPVEVDEEAEKLCRRKQTNRTHSVSHHGLTDAEFTRCMEQGIDMAEFLERKLKKEATAAVKEEGGGRKRRRTKVDDSDSE